MDNLQNNEIQPIPQQPTQAPITNLKNNVPLKSNNIVIWILITLVLIIVLLVASIFRDKIFVRNLDTSNIIETPTVNQSTYNLELISHTVATIPEDLNTRLGEYMEQRFIFDDIGKQVLYPARKGERGVLMSNNESLGNFLQLYHLEKSVDGSRINYAGLKVVGEQKGSPLVDFVINGESQDKGTPVYGSEVTFSRDGKHHAYIIYTAEKKMVVIYDGLQIYKGNLPQNVINSKVQSGYTPYSPIFSSDGLKLMTVSQNGLKQRVVIIHTDTKETVEDPQFDHIHNVTFGHTGSHYAYRTTDEEKEFIIIDGTIRKTLDSNSGVAWAPVFNSDDTKISYAVNRKAYNAIDLKKGVEIPYEQKDFLSLLEIDAQSTGVDYVSSTKIFDSSGENWIRYGFDTNASELAKEERYFVEINGIKVNKTFQFVSKPHFGETGRFVLFGVRDGNELKWIVYEITEQGLVQK